jgi:putative ABC transport system permease protein
LGSRCANTAGQIRDKDEDYWNEYRGTPKAFISYEVGKQLWENRFGTCTAIRIPAASIDQVDLEKRLAEIISPQSQGFALRSVKEEGLAPLHVVAWILVSFSWL